MAAAASSLLAPLLAEKLTHLEVLGSSTEISWFKLNDQVLTVQRASPGSARALPTSIFTPVGSSLKSQLELREAQLWLNGRELRISRWWLPPRAQLSSYSGIFGPEPEVATLLGRGAGLTPEGDDLIAGWLVAARSISHPSFETIWVQVKENSTLRTTSFSAALLDYAGKGFGIESLINYVSARLTNAPNTQLMKRRLETVGHTSGKALALGVEMAIGLVPDKFDPTRVFIEERANA